MAVSTQEFPVFGCDSEDCDIVRTGGLDGTLPKKFRAGTTLTTDKLDGPSVPWFACRESHIAKAVAAVQARAAAAQPAEDEPVREDETDSAEFDENEEVPEFATAH